MMVEVILGRGQALHTPNADKSSVTVEAKRCDTWVPPVAESLLGNCAYYYRPLHGEYVKKSGVSTWQAVKAWASQWNPWDDREVARRLLSKRDRLIPANSSDEDWSRHASFMVRHIGCGHRPPEYYVSYGYYYCSIYGEKLRPRLTAAGQDWLDNARYGLQINMEDGLRSNMKGAQIEIVCKRYPNRTARMSVQKYLLEVTPDTFKTFAFRTHVPAYLDAGLADLPLGDLLRIGGQPNIEEWLDKETWQQAIESGAVVAAEKAGAATERVGEAAERALEALTRYLRG
ncbi:hypothetical protein P3W55_09460 [Pseudomonas citronellolis]|uniref:Uncharacterized protein n=1 Tax=Pseudomonas citronellolis TaxID=53408 RepID=A0AAW6P432_9PSED|nr:hypothetical protein [Pseudomonas citronellolis]MDF3841937.1 hypothetical protein [Pseudomonas citronellolis]WBG65614.1 hypothetical protein ELR50_23000 [Pseudomonas citronellolis]